MLTQARLKDLLKYDPKTGAFTWLVRPTSNVHIGKVAGCLNAEGYRQIGIDGKTYLAHRLAHLYVEGYFPEYVMDHKKTKSNKWSNIRHVTHACNMQNMKKIPKDNKSGFVGVGWVRREGKWRAFINLHNQHTSLGYHADKISAALARCEFEKCCPKWTCNHQAVNFVQLRELGYKI